MKTLALSVAVISVLLAGAASAADLRRPAPVTAPVAPVAVAYNWTGCYVGGGGGYGMWNQETTFVILELGPFGASNDNAGRGWFGTVQVGCDYQIGSNIVIGAFADYDWSGMKGNMSIASQNRIGEEKLKSSWAAGGRVGWIPFQTSQLLVYLSGGYTEARFDAISFIFAPTGFQTEETVGKHTYTGWFIGSGYEYGFGWLPGLFWKTEYRFADYGTDRLPYSGFPGPTFIDVHKRIQTVRSELVWRFNFGGPVVARY